MPDPILLVTGASGYVGQHLARRLAAGGRRVAGTFFGNPVDLAPVEMVPVDLTDERAVERLVRDMRPAAIVHLAAETKVGWCEEHPGPARAAIVEATGHLCRAAARHAPGAPLLAFSTDLVYGGENAPCTGASPVKPLSAYGSLKYAAEQPVLEHPTGRVLRSALVYGPPATRRESFLQWMVTTLRDGRTLTMFEDEWRTPVLVDDLAQAVELMLELPSGGPAENRVLTAGGPGRLNRVEMGEAVCEVFGLDRSWLRTVQRHDLPGGHLRPRDVSLDSSALVALGWKQTPFREGLIACRNRWNS